MEVKRVASDYVALDQIDSDSKGEDLVEVTGYNDQAIDDANDGDIIDVKDNNYDAYNVLKELKAGDKVAVIPYTTDDGRTWEVGEAYVPEEVSGTLTKSTGYATSSLPKGNAITVTVGGTEYPIAQWNKDLRGINADLIKATRKDVTLLLDKMGNALLAKDVGNADDWMIVCDYYQAPASNGGKVVWFAHGKSLDGKEDIDVNLGTIRGEAELYAPGSIVHYDIANDGTGEYVLSHRNGVEGAYEIARYYMKDGVAARYEISNKNQLVPLVDLNIEEQVYGEETVSGVDPVTGNAFDTFKYQPGVYSNVKFVFVDFDSNGEVETFIVKDGPLSTDWEDLIKFNEKWENIGTNDKNAYGNFCAEAYVSKKGEVKTVVIKDDTGDADLTNIILTTDTTRDEEVDANGVKWHGRKIVRGSNDFKSEESVLLDRFTNVGDFSRIVKETEDDGTKKLEIKALAGEFENDSVEPLKVFGIDYAKNANDSKNDKIGFVVGQGTNKVEDLQGNTLIAPAPAARASKTIVADFLGRESNMGDSVLDSDRIEGLIRVDSKTQWIDLRDIQDDRIDSLEELVSGDYDLSKVELRVLMNADKGSGSFRHAYVVAIIKAPVALPHPVFTVSNGTTTAESFTIKEGESITLTATCSGLTNDKSAGTVTYSWSVDGKAAGKGSSITLNSLTLGEHKVVVTATSDVKDTASTVKTITITVGEVKNVEEVTGTTEAITETMAKNVKATAQTMQTTGETRLNLEVEAPDWASTKTEAVLGTVSWKAVANGKEYTGTVDLNKSTGTGVKATAVDGATFKGYVEITSSDAWDTAALKRTDMVGKTLTSLEITGITWKYAKVNYVYAAEGEAEPVAITDGLTAGYTEYLPVGANGTLAFTYTKPAELTGTAVITVTGVDGEPKTVTSPVSETVKANGGEVVLVTVSGVTAPEPAVERTVKSSLTGTKALEFTVAAAGTTAPAADAEWAAEVKAEAGEVVFMRAAGEVALLATDSTGLAAITAIDTDTTTAVSLSAAQVVSGTASFTMVNQNLTIVGATVTTPEVDAYTVAEDGSTNILLKAAYTFADDNQKLQFVADYLKSEGISVTVNKGTSGTDILSLTISGVTVQPANIKVSNTLAKVKVGTDTIVCADVAGTATVANALDLAKVTIANAGANVYVGLVKTGGTTAQATDSMTTALTGVTEILVNEGRGYAKMASPAITVADSGATGQTTANKPSVALDTASAALTFTDTNAYYPIGKELTVVGTFTAANLGSFTAGAKFVESTATNFELVSSEELPAQTAAGTANAEINAVIKVTGGAATVTISLATADI
nr:hypothetical protein [uncultured Oscillibacter sp.]